MKTKQQSKYKVQGTFASSHAPSVRWGGWTQDRAVAEERLTEAEAYAVRRVAAGGQHIDWKIIVRLTPIERTDDDVRPKH